MSSLEELGGDVEEALEAISVPSYVIDSSGVIRWLNPAALRMVGDVRGRHYTSVVAPEETRRARERFTQKILGTAGVTDAEAVLLDETGERLNVEISSVPLKRGGQVIGVFGQVSDLPHEPHPPHPHLTPRQSEVLRLLERGHSTEQIAAELNLSKETVRNHVRHVLRALGAKSRLEAVALSRGR
ncbi:MAG TPA: LuxR C-terminal-related transcriptional regulator [Gaiellaceae bacterium]|jgi:PAS domain S-box-containing protein